MNSKFKIALLTLLGFSASACCGTKRVAKGEDKSEPNIMIQEENDPRVHLMVCHSLMVALYALLTRMASLYHRHAMVLNQRGRNSLMAM